MDRKCKDCEWWDEEAAKAYMEERFGDAGLAVDMGSCIKTSCSNWLKIINKNEKACGEFKPKEMKE